MAGIKCKSNTLVNSQITLNTDVPTFIGNINAFKDAIVTGLGSPFNEHRNWLTINSMRTGSVIVDTTLNVP